MEEDIKILEEFLNLKTIDNKIVFTEKFLEVFKEPIRNIITRYKELEKQLNLEIEGRSLLLTCLKNNYIQKSKVKEILEQYKYIEIGDTEKLIEKLIEFYKKLQELLEE